MRQLLILLSLCLLIVSCGHTSPQDKVLLSRADSLMEAHPDSALTLLQHITDSKRLSSPDHALYALLMSQALDKNNIEVQSDSLIRIATAYYHGGKDLSHAGYAWFYLSRVEENRGDAEGQAEALLKAQTYAMRSHNDKLLGFVYGDKAKMYQDQNQLDSMLHYNRLAYSNLKKAGDKRNCIVCLLVIGYSHYLEKQYKTALVYYNLALQECTDTDFLLVSSIHRQQCLAYYCLKNYHKALYFARLSTLSSDMYDYSKTIDLAMIFNKLNQLDSADFYLRKCTNPHEMAPEYYQTRINVCAKQKKWDAVIYYMDKLVIAKDSLYKHSLLESFAGLEKKYNYQRIAAENKTLIITNQENKNLILLLLLSLSVSALILLLWRFRQKQQQLEQHKALIKQEQALVEKEKENNRLLQHQLTMQQALVKNIELYKRIAMDRLFRSNAKSDNNVKEKASLPVDSSAFYEEFISSMDALYLQYSTRLANQYPQLTKNDLLICCLLHAGLDSAMIASLLNIQITSLHITRTRLRKKLYLTHDENLLDFLAKF
jgi:hypothetical protein